MNETQVLVEKITEGIQEKKGKNIIIVQVFHYLSGKFSQPSPRHYRLRKRLCKKIHG